MIHFSSILDFHELLHVSGDKIKILVFQDIYLNIFSLINYELNLDRKQKQINYLNMIIGSFLSSSASHETFSLAALFF